MKRILGAVSAALMIGSLVSLTAGIASPAAAAGTACTVGPTGKVGSKLTMRTVEAGALRSTWTQKGSASYTPRAFVNVGGLGDPTFWQGTYLVPSTDGKLRLVTMTGKTGGGAMTTKVDAVVRSGFKPHKVAGTWKHVYAVTKAGSVYQRPVTTEYGIGASKKLPLRLKNVKAVTAYTLGSSDVLYAVKTDGALAQVVVPAKTGNSRVYRLKSSGFQKFDGVVPGYCPNESSIPLLFVDNDSGVAYQRRHDAALKHQGATLRARTQVGGAHAWRNWRGLGG